MSEGRKVLVANGKIFVLNKEWLIKSTFSMLSNRHREHDLMFLPELEEPAFRQLCI